MDRSSRQKVNKATEILNDTIEQLDLIDVFIVICLKVYFSYHLNFMLTHWFFFLSTMLFSLHVIFSLSAVNF